MIDKNDYFSKYRAKKIREGFSALIRNGKVFSFIFLLMWVYMLYLAAYEIILDMGGMLALDDMQVAIATSYIITETVKQFVLTTNAATGIFVSVLLFCLIYFLFQLQSIATSPLLGFSYNRPDSFKLLKNRLDRVFSKYIYRWLYILLLFLYSPVIIYFITIRNVYEKTPESLGHIAGFLVISVIFISLIAIGSIFLYVYRFKSYDPISLKAYFTSYHSIRNFVRESLDSIIFMGFLFWLYVPFTLNVIVKSNEYISSLGSRYALPYLKILNNSKREVTKNLGLYSDAIFEREEFTESSMIIDTKTLELFSNKFLPIFQSYTIYSILSSCFMVILLMFTVRLYVGRSVLNFINSFVKNVAKPLFITSIVCLSLSRFYYLEVSALSIGLIISFLVGLLSTLEEM